jgi:hypothetical protein
MPMFLVIFMTSILHAQHVNYSLKTAKHVLPQVPSAPIAQIQHNKICGNLRMELMGSAT